MKTAVFDTDAAILRPSRLFKITRRDGTIYYLTEAQEPITIGLNTWVPVLGTLQNIRSTLGTAVPSTTFRTSMHADGPFKPVDVDNGKFKDARFEVYLTDRFTPTAGHYFTGWIGKTSYGWPQTLEFQIRGALAKAKGSVMQHFGPMCRTDTGSALCKLPIKPDDVARATAYALGDFVRVRTKSPITNTPNDYENRIYEVTNPGTTHATTQPTFDTAIDATTVDGGVIFTTRNSWTRWARVANITDDGHGIVLTANPDPRATTAAWFQEGYMNFITGYSATESEPIAFWSLGNLKMTLYRSMTDILAVDDWLEVQPGDDKIAATCQNKFNNRKNFRGEPHVLGADVATPGNLNAVPTQTVQ